MVHVSSHGAKDGSEEAFDYRGNPPDKSKTGGWLGAGLILGSELSERICVMGISMNLVTYLVGDLHISSAKSATIVTNFMGTLNLLGLLGGFLADAKLGRYKMVAISASVTALGVLLLTVATTIPSMRPPPCDDFRRLHHQCVEANGHQLALLYVALYTIALGGGGIKSNVSGFGSDQFDTSDPKEEKQMIFFFNRFYFSISLGSLFAVIALVYVQDNVGRGWGYGISAATMVVAAVILLCGTKLYRFKKPKGSPFTVIWRVCFLAWKKRKESYPSHKSLLNGYDNTTVPHTERLKCLDKAAVVVVEESSPSTTKEFKEKDPWMVSTVTQVEEVKLVVKLIPIWATNILFWTIYSQMTTFTVEQATFMERKLGSFTVPAGSYSAFLILTILLFTSLNERVFVPLARKVTKKPQGITSLQRIGVGLVLSMGAMAVAAVIENARREAEVTNGYKISAFWLIPQYFLVGAGEAFAYVGQLEFFIREAPERMKSMSTGLFLSTISMGFFVSSLLVSLVDKVTHKSWLRSNLNKARLNYFYWLLVVLGAFNFLVFIVFAMRHQYKADMISVGVDDSQEKEKDNEKDKSELELKDIP
ncbi:Protein NRT1/ PTR FAMILY 6.4 [Raphanus sativus]|uniref:Protein NRT1/ PTR FAMILY 6.4 n=1 Tax=Raphanus sativus TaxID=3726 RepID=A0A6J0JAG0_RAPSA|nr:protein NRT1/ PTR FAMILY 6.4 [Raphanus sativus]KAJ4894234.1 Protein NRT1/ PTR FAMILY 6.4 [Raphanus sativus]